MKPSGFFGFTVTRPVAVFMITTAVAVFGAVSWRRLALNLVPDISYPSITIRTEMEGAAPEDVERGVTEPIEEAVGVVGGLVQISSVSRAGASDVTLEFEWDTKMDTALQEIREKLDHLVLPREAKRPILLRYDPNLDPVMRVGVTGSRTLVELRKIAEDDVRRSLESTPGVAAVKVRGGREEEIRVELHRAALSQLGLDPRQVAEKLGQENLNVASGSLIEGDVEYLVRTLNEFRTDAEIGSIVVARKGDADVLLSQVAKIRRVSKDPQVIARIDGNEAVLLDIYREADANIVAVADAVRVRLEGEPEAWYAKYTKKFAQGRGGAPKEEETEGRVRLPKGIRAPVLSDQSTFVRDAIASVRDAAWQGALLAVVVLFLFLRSVQDTLIIGVSIPLSIIGTFGAMHVSGVSLNVMSLGGLALGVGMMVDASIVVLDSIARCREEGDDRAGAAMRGTKEVGLAVSASTLTTVVVFFPIAFVEGIAGQIFRDQALTVCMSLMMSMGVSLFFVPMLASRQWAASPAESRREIFRLSSLSYFSRIREGWDSGFLGRLDAALAALVLPVALALEIPLRILLAIAFGLAWIAFRAARLLGIALGFAIAPILWVFNRFMGAVNEAYPRALRVALSNRVVVGAACLAAFAASFRLVPGLAQELIPTMHQGEFVLEIALPVGTPIERTDLQVAEIEKFVLATPGVASAVTAVGVEDDANRRESEGENTARIRVRLHPAKDTAAAEESVLAALRERFRDLPDVTMKVAHPVLFSFRTPVELEVRGHDLAEIRRAARDAEAALAKLPQLTDVKSTVGRGNPEIRIFYNRARLAEYGLDINAVATIVQHEVLGTEATKLAEAERKVPVRVKGSDADVAELGRVETIVVNPGAPIPVRLGAVATFDRAEGPNEIRRVAHQRAALVRANVAGYDLGGAARSIEEAVAGLPKSRDVQFSVGGQSRELRASGDSLVLALVLAAFLVYVVMAAQFESLLHPFLIMFTLPMAFVGVILALKWTATPVSVIVAIGAIVLAGIAVNNAIVLIDAANQLRRAGADPTDAIVRASKSRLRPVLMTSLTTILGLLPMAIGLGQGSELQSPLAVTVLGGMLSSTFLTLILIPVLWHAVESRRAS
ncbi:MAG: efflux RND transporter permease subunit [Planctomycetes bacterium]|nr:efflux RND transporter permease subunit [Planctomycetota bacterium]